MPKDDDLDLQFAIRTRTTGPDHAAEQRVEESEQHDRAMPHRRWSGRRVRENVPFTQFRMNFTGWGNSMFSIRASSFTPLRSHHAKLKLGGLGHPAGIPGRLHYHLDVDVLDARHA